MRNLPGLLRDMLAAPGVPLVLVALSLVVRIGWMIYARPVPVSDFEEYRSLAAGLLDAHQFGVPLPTAFRLPGYPVFLALAMSVSRSPTWLGLLNVALSALLALTTYVLTLRLTNGNRVAAGIAGLFCTLNPDFVVFAPILASEHLSALLICASLLVAWRSGSHPFLRASTVGILAGLAALTRGESLFLSPLLMGLLVVKNPNRSRAAVSVLLALAVCALCVTPWWLRNRQLFGPGVGLSTSVGVNYYHAHNGEYYGWRPIEETALAGLGEGDAHRLGFELGSRRLRDDPRLVLLDTARGTIRHYWPSPYGIIWSVLRHDASGWSARELPGRFFLEIAITVTLLGTYFLAVLSVFFLRRYRPATWLVLYGIVGLNWLCYCAVFWGKARYRFSAEIAAGILAAMVVSPLLERAARPATHAAPR